MGCLGLVLLSLNAWSSETALRVAFVYNFIKFIDWPNNASGSSIHICVLNADLEMQEAFGQINGKTAKKLLIESVFLKGRTLSSEQIQACQILYRPSRSASIALPKMIPAGVVIVTDEFEDTDSLSSINLLMTDDGRLEFTINQAAINNAGVVVSSQLLKLAKNNR